MGSANCEAYYLWLNHYFYFRFGKICIELVNFTSFYMCKISLENWKRSVVVEKVSPTILVKNT